MQYKTIHTKLNFKIQLIFFLIIFLFCTNKPEQQKTINEKTFVQIYCDVITQADYLKEKQKQAFVDSVLNQHHVTRQAFENTIERYKKNPKKWKSVFEKIVAELENRLELLENPNKSNINKTNKKTDID